ncbi:hypothetical protein ACWEJJ_23410, partial [Streptomyces rubiginosohelvolus]
MEDRDDPPVPRPRTALADPSARAGPAHAGAQPAARAAGAWADAARPRTGPDPAAAGPQPGPRTGSGTAGQVLLQAGVQRELLGQRGDAGLEVVRVV